MTAQPFRAFRPRVLQCLALVLCLFLIGPALAAAQRPYVVLVSLDGFRFDYADRYDARNLKSLGRDGVAAAMIPAFPSLTFPNHLSIVTGLYPEHHGIVENNFYDPAMRRSFSMRDAPEGVWYGGIPLWVLAERQGLHAASYFWPGSEAEIQGVRPSLFERFDDSTPAETRLQTILSWLKQPEETRPHFITLYLSDTDQAGHDFGPDSEETRKAVQTVDGYIGELRAVLNSLQLPIDLIVVSDHGMQLVDQGSVDLTQYIDLNKVHIEGGGALALLYAPDPQTVERTYRSLKGKSPHFDVYRRDETPPAWHYRKNARIGDLVVAAIDASFLIVRKRNGTLPKGEHGYDPRKMETMRAVFFAAGPNIKPGSKLEPFDNVNVYPFIARILGLKVPANLDGSGKVLDPIYRQ